MSEDSIIDAYQLIDITVSPDQLLLDPQNPRIRLKTDRDIAYSPQQLASVEVQNYVMSVVDTAEFHVAELIKAIGREGFLDQGNRMILEHVDGTSKYLVVEGNRRLTAIRHLLGDPAVLSPRVLKSLNSIKAHELVLTGKSGHNREKVIFKILGKLHLRGQLEWGSMERAFYIYQAYMLEFKQAYKYSDGDEFYYDVDCSRWCGETLDMKPKSVRTELAIYLVYAQLRENSYDVQESHYSLISLAVRTRGMNYKYFGWDGYSLQLSLDGLERFSKLCLEEERPVHNPGDFKNVAKVYKEGSERDMELIEAGESSLEEVVERVENRLTKHEFLLQVKKIEKNMSSLHLYAPLGLKREVEVITRIRDIANQILRSFQ